MKNIIVITGASSGFGAPAARALATAGHTVYASMRETAGRNAAQVEDAKQFYSFTELLIVLRVFLRTATWRYWRTGVQTGRMIEM
jgi:NADP-dependent 3-hydroxy acid dehydrogenase YdfG